VQTLAPSSRPAILMTAATHSRELITIQMVMFTALNLLHKGLILKDPKAIRQLAQNVYYIVPTINVDGVAFIE